jgi:hypothetical protein
VVGAEFPGLHQQFPWHMARLGKLICVALWPGGR